MACPGKQVCLLVCWWAEHNEEVSLSIRNMLLNSLSPLLYLVPSSPQAAGDREKGSGSQRRHESENQRLTITTNSAC